jgi:hypothetical protein
MALRLVSENGEIVDASEEVWAQEILRLEDDLAGSEREVRRLRRIVAKQERELLERAEASDLMPQVKLVFDHWRRATGHKNSKLGQKRIDACLARLKEGYSVQQLCLACDGIAFDPEKKRRRNGRWEVYDDLDLALRDEKHLEKYANRSPRKGEQ